MINQYVIYGERHSGTKFLEKLINKNFTITKSQIFGHKHFFRPNYIFQSSQNILRSTLFICIVRNPYDWIMAFHKERHHCGVVGATDIYKFMSKEWISRNNFLGPEIMQDRHIYIDRRYKNIFEMRSSKIEYLYNILPYYTYNYMFLRYEDFLSHRTINWFLNKLVYSFKLETYKAIFDIEDFKNKKYYYNHIDDCLLKYINNSIEWNIENRIGYTKADSIAQLKNHS